MSFVSVRPATLSDAVLGRRAERAWVRDALLVVLFSGFVALTARISVPLPFTPVPVTGQTLGVLLTGAVLGWRRGALALALYLVEGALGLPVWAPSATLLPGIGRLLGPTGGYLWAYPFAAALVGFLAERGWDRRFALAVLAMVLGNVVIYAFGVAWLALFYSNVQQALLTGLVPFVVGDLLKIAVAAVVLPGAWALARRK